MLFRKTNFEFSHSRAEVDKLFKQCAREQTVWLCGPAGLFSSTIVAGNNDRQYINKWV